MTAARLAVVATVCLTWTGSARAQSAPTCSFDPATATVTVNVNGGHVDVVASWTGRIHVNGGPCGGATVTSTDTILINGMAERDLVHLRGSFVPGKTGETDGASEIEISFALGDRFDTALVQFEDDRERIVLTSGGIDIGNDLDQDITVAGTERLSIDGQGGNDIIDGSAYTGGGLEIQGGNGHDRITGSGLSDDLFGGSGNDTIYGGLLDDTITGGTGDDALYGGPGLDRFVANSALDGSDLIRGGGDVDLVTYQNRTVGVTVTLGDGLANDGAPGENDDIVGVEDAVGGSGPDVLVGSGAANSLNGLFGDDEIYGDRGDDTLNGEGGRDIIHGDDGDDLIFAGVEADTIDGGAGHDDIFGQAGSDFIVGGPGRDRIYGDQGNDIIFNADGLPDRVECGVGDADDAEPDPLDTFIGCEL